MTNNPAIEFAKEKNLKNRSLESKYDLEFVNDVNKYINIFITQANDMKKYAYKRPNKQIILLPYITFLGIVTIENIYKEPFETCCRYAIYEEALKEYDTAVEIIEEINNRLQQSEKIWNTLDAEKLKVATVLVKTLKKIRGVLSTGLNMLEHMKDYTEGGQLNDFDLESKEIYKWKETKSLNVWGF